MSCPICIEYYNENDNKIFSCEHCNTSLCTSCVKDHILKSPTSICYSCKKEWSILNILNFYSEYQETFFKKYLEREQSLFFSVEREIKKTIVKEREIEKLKKEIREEKDNKVVKKLMEKLRNNDFEIFYVFDCPNFKCSGIVTNDYFCESCTSVICKKCKEISHCFTDEIFDHVCDKNLLKTIETLKFEKTTYQKCPNCDIYISKESGCDQMWCVNCKTAFDWKTGTIDRSGVIHNPHYFQYKKTLEKQKRVQELSQAVIRKKYELSEFLISNYNNGPNKGKPKFPNHKHEYVIFIKNISELSLDMTDNLSEFSKEEKDNFEWRRKLVQKEISENKFESEMKKKFRINLKNKLILEILIWFLDYFVICEFPKIENEEHRNSKFEVTRNKYFEIQSCRTYAVESIRDNIQIFNKKMKKIFRAMGKITILQISQGKTADDTNYFLCRTNSV
jgi:hypothetical protein